jgi:hypothetical protein
VVNVASLTTMAARPACEAADKIVTNTIKAGRLIPRHPRLTLSVNPINKNLSPPVGKLKQALSNIIIADHQTQYQAL